MANGKKTLTKRSRSKAKKMIPAVRYLRYELTNSGTPGTETSHYLDISRDLSAINRRLMRQGRDYHIKRVTVISSNTNQNQGADPNAATNAGRVSFSTLPNSWMVRSAWKRGFETWNKMNATALENGPTVKPTWHDYKIRGMGSYAQSPTYLVPKDNGGNDLNLGEWTYSTYETPDGTTGADAFAGAGVFKSTAARR